MRRWRGLQDPFLRSALLAAMFFVASRAPAAAEDCAPPRLENSVKLEPLGEQGLMMVPITLDGVEKKFLFDTGGAHNYVSSKVVEEFKLPQLGSAPLLDMRGNRSDSAVVIKDVTLGTLRASFIRFQVGSDLPYDGILSSRPLGKDRYNLPGDDLDMDFGAMTLKFFSPDHCAGHVVTWPHQSLAVVPVTTIDGHIELPVTLDGQPLRAVIDTGASWTVVNLARARQKLGFSPEQDVPGARDGPKDDPAKQVYLHRYSALSLEGITIANPLVVVRPVQFGGKDNPILLASRAQHAADYANQHAPDIIIGMEILRHLHIYYAAEEQKLYVTPAAPG